ncbi:hypothetical protein HD806DRAFT_527701 [Xylariaceae sp. AK1471]|nr:hypothetical protein HD806DRAFT_527701 [Xylariaceae sp. AK1471]
MKPIKSSEPSLLATPQREERRPAMKRSISTKSQIKGHVKWDTLPSPRSPITERSVPRLEHCPSLQSNISSRSNSRLERSSARVPPRNDGDVEVLKRIVNTLRLRKVPGPQLFRARTEFKKKLGFGAEGNVRTTDQYVNEEIKSLELCKVEGSQIERPKWNKFAIKRHGPHDINSGLKLKNYLAAAEAEIHTLSKLLRGHPNIVQLRGWGLCLDTIESTQNTSEPPTDLSTAARNRGQRKASPNPEIV